MNAIGDVKNPLFSFQGISNYLENKSLDEKLLQLAEMTAKILSAENCSIMLFGNTKSENSHMRVCASYGLLPAVAYKESIGKGEGIAGHVFATGQSLLIEDIKKSRFANRARRANDPRKSLISSPIEVNTCIVGVVNVCGHREVFNKLDLNLLDVIALFIGKSIQAIQQAIQLQISLNSRSAQLALIQEAQENIGNSPRNALHNPGQVANILTKSFYKEMIRAGFSSSQIIYAASEIITRLNGKLQRHNKRMENEIAKSADKISQRITAAYKSEKRTFLSH